MKFTITALACAAFILFSGFTKGEHTVPGCYTSFKAEGLKTQAPEALTDEDKNISLETAAGHLNMVVTNGYNVAYINKNKASVVTLKVARADASAYGKDTAAVLANLRYLNSGDVESKGLITLSYNGYKIYGTSHNTAADKGARGSFVMFPGNNTIICVTFNNTAGSTESLDDYKSRRNTFLGAYTAHIQNCR